MFVESIGIAISKCSTSFKFLGDELLEVVRGLNTCLAFLASAKQIYKIIIRVSVEHEHSMKQLQ